MTGDVPARLRSTASRPAASPVKFDIVAPVTKPTALPSGSPSRSSSQALATSSTALCAGVTRRRPEFWSQALTSQSAARAAGWVPPMTNPKKRPDGIRGKAGVARLRQQVDDVFGLARGVGQFGAERVGHLVDRGLGRDRSSLKGGQPVQGVPVRSVERC